MKRINRTLIFCFFLLVFCCSSQFVFAVDKLNLNTATIEQLVELKGIGQKTAEKIIEYRQKQAFSSVDELVMVKGVGEKTLAGIRDQLAVEPIKQ